MPRSKVMDYPGQANRSDGPEACLKKTTSPPATRRTGRRGGGEAGLDGLGAIQEAIQVRAGHDSEVRTRMQTG